MKHKVIKMFKDMDGSFKKPGDIIEADGFRAIKLHQYGFIGGRAETAKIEPQEKAVKEKPKNKKRGRNLVDTIEEVTKIEPADEENKREEE